MRLQPGGLESVGNLPNSDLAAKRCRRDAPSIRTERLVLNDFFCVEPGYLVPAYNVPQMRRAVAASGQQVDVVGTEDREGRPVFVRKSGRQGSIDIPKPRGAVVRSAEKYVAVDRASSFCSTSLLDPSSWACSISSIRCSSW